MSLFWLDFFQSSRACYFAIRAQFSASAFAPYRKYGPDFLPSLSSSLPDAVIADAAAAARKAGIDRCCRCSVRLKLSSGENEIVRWPRPRRFIVYVRSILAKDVKDMIAATRALLYSF